MSQNSEYTYLTDEAFEKEIIQNNKLVVVEFGAEWCGCCRVMAPIVREISITYQNRISVVRLDVDRNNHLVKKYSIRIKPTYLFIENGEVLDNIIGSAPRIDFENKLNLLLSIK